MAKKKVASNSAEAMKARARENMVSSEIEQFPLGEEQGGVYLGSEHAKKPRKSKKGDMEPGMIHTLDVDGDKRRFWGFGLLNYFLEENKIVAGDYILVTRKDKGENGMWGAEFGFAKAE